MHTFFLFSTVHILKFVSLIRTEWGWKHSDNFQSVKYTWLKILKMLKRNCFWLEQWLGQELLGRYSWSHKWCRQQRAPGKERKRYPFKPICLPCAWRQEVSLGFCPILSAQSYQVVDLSFDLVNNVESWRQLPPPLVSRASPFPHKTFMKPVINRPDKGEGSRFQNSAAPLKMPFSASKVPLFEEQTQTINSHRP